MGIVLANDVATPLGLLLSIMADGERIARDCAIRQARAAEDARSQRFFAAQARHEHFHAILFRQAAKRLGTRGRGHADHSLGLRRYARQLDVAMEAGRWSDVVIGQQLVLENLGELVLSKLDREMAKRGAGFERIRALVLRQERAHHRFGTQWIQARLHDGRIRPAEMRDGVERYVALADRVLMDVAGLLEGVEADAEAYRCEIRERLPAWAMARPA